MYIIRHVLNYCHIGIIVRATIEARKLHYLSHIFMICHKKNIIWRLKSLPHFASSFMSQLWREDFSISPWAHILSHMYQAMCHSCKRKEHHFSFILNSYHVNRAILHYVTKLLSFWAFRSVYCSLCITFLDIAKNRSITMLLAC